MKRIVLTGPESTGKSVLSQQLAKRYNSLWLPEYARFYIAALKREYTYKDVLHIAKRQIQLEEELALFPNEYLFLDTDLIITKVWLEHVYNMVPKFIDDAIKRLPRHMHLLCDYDLPWEADPTRENPDKREFFFNWYKRELQNYNIEFKLVSGSGSSRFDSALKCLEKK